MIEVTGLTKVYGRIRAVDELSFTVRPGQVTGFLGPNGAGKSTTMRMILALDRPTAGRATVGGRPYRAHAAPLCAAGALLDARAAHPGRTARDHLVALGQTHGIPPARADALLDEVGLAAAARRRVGGFSLGMAQRLGIAAALLGDPAVVLLDEPVNGLDPDGVLWMRTLLKRLAADGRTVLVSSHLMSEMAVTADHLLVIDRGRLLADTSLDALIGRAGVFVRGPRTDALRDLFRSHGAAVADEGAGLLVTGLEADAIGAVATGRGLVLHELTPRRASLEQAYMELTRVGER
ncbi:ABC transporter ATP-binding protein [Asanoa iriomotensis]|uniref:Multidrug ABC transporter ATP-binding protein n=1 Tax=Asanoa iriomotensis TaxID=234613 RepID=A0ABQ4BYK9_9ACTN|nr:ATP-binding cassette domain-containing protein [Asanoa iriomotensis]GIF55624.1 multidrug ABC transporter ATP-binding protein [Asanoa iriomotensis]